jgi:hypothetical protein
VGTDIKGVAAQMSDRPKKIHAALLKAHKRLPLFTWRELEKARNVRLLGAARLN